MAYPPPHDYAFYHSHETPPKRPRNAAIAPQPPPPQYTPFLFAPPSILPHYHPTTQGHAMVQPPEHWDFENMPPTITYPYDQRGNHSQNRKRKQAMDNIPHDKRARQDEAHAYQDTTIRYPQLPHEPTHNTMPAEPLVYVPSAATYMPQERQTSAPYLPAAERYQRRQLVQQHPSSSQDNSHAANTSRAREHTKPKPSAAAPSFWEQTSRRSEIPKEQSMSRNLCEPNSERLSRVTASPAGSQLNPVDLASSPEPECRKPLKKRNKKKNFYAVAAGRVPGIYKEWVDAEHQIKGFSGAKHQGFATEDDALRWLEENMNGYHVPDHKVAERAANRAAVQSELEMHKRYTAAMQSENASHASLSSAGQTGLMGPYERDMRTGSDAADFLPLPLTTQGADAPRMVDTSDPDPILKPEQQEVVDLILEGHNVFYTGSAGCGKSTILKSFVKQLQLRGKMVKIVAPTNLAALNVGGVTTWNFAGWIPDSMKMSIDTLMKKARGDEVWERFDKTDVLVIDEISMVENLLFERLNQIMRASIGEKYGGGAFGGIQIVVTGDFCQLSPVRPFKYCMCGWELERDNKWRPKEYRCENKRCREDTFLDIDKWAFRSKAWEECKFKHINLTEIHRQSDKMFISILQKIRTEGVILKPHAHVLLNHKSETTDGIKLFARRDDVDRINNENIAKLPTEVMTYKCLDDFSWKDHHRDDSTLEKNNKPGEEDGTLAALKEHRYEVYVHLKKDMRVVLQANLETGAGLVNGSQGTIVDFEPFDDKRLPRKADRSEVGDPGATYTRGAHARYFEEQIKIYGKQNKRLPWPVVQFDNGQKRTIFADCTASELGNEEPYSLLSRTQIPLMAGYAITIHKCQGMTLDKVIVDLSRAFEPSQIYVALSRARSLAGLKVTGLPRTSLGGANEQVKEFFAKYLTKPKQQLEPPSSSAVQS